MRIKKLILAVVLLLLIVVATCALVSCNNEYNLIVECNLAEGSVSGGGTYQQGSSVTISAKSNLGYIFVGWYEGETLISNESTYSFIIDKDITYKAMFQTNSDVSNLIFEASNDTCVLKGIKDNTVKEIYVPNYVTKIEKGIFSDCASIECITLPYVGGSKTSDNFLGYIFGADSAEENSVKVPKSLKKVIVTDSENIANSAFSDCNNITNIVLLNNLKAINSKAFENCINLTSITVPSGLIAINQSAFAGCYALVEVYNLSALDITCGSEDFGGIAQYALDVYNSTDEPSKLNYKDDMILRCDNDKTTLVKYIGVANELLLNNDITSIATGAFKDCKVITDLCIPDSVTSIGDNAFTNCINLNKISIGNSVITIGKNAFSGCGSLISVSIPDSVITIGNNALAECGNLTNAVIGNGIKEMGDGIFLSCNNLNSLSLPFVGATKEGTEKTHLGNLFGADNYIDNAEYVPELLKNIIISGNGEIYANTFYNCSNLISIRINNGVTAIGDSAFFNCSKLADISLPNSVRTIGNNAFHNCISLENLSIPNGITTIGSGAFSMCSGLKTVDISDSVTSIGLSAFDKCDNLISIKLPFVGATKDDIANGLFGYIFAGVSGGVPQSLKNIEITGGTVIRDSAFKDCKNITNIILPDSISSIEDYAFENCRSLTNFNIPDSVTIIGNQVFESCTSLNEVSMPTNITYIGKKAFYACNQLTNINMPDSITVIDDQAFENCLKLSNLKFGSSLTTIGKRAFYNCEAIYSVDIPENVTSIGYSAFGQCNSISNMTVPFVGANKNSAENSIFGYIFGAMMPIDNPNYVPTALKKVVVTEGEVIADYAFYHCENIKSISLPNSITEIKNAAFIGCLELSNLNLGDNIEYIGHYAFSDCKKLLSITIPNSIREIDICSLYDCESLTSITLPFISSMKDNEGNVRLDYLFGGSEYGATVPKSLNSVTITTAEYIDANAFRNCSNITSITLPDSVTKIGDNAFLGCSGLSNIRIPSEVISIGDSAFKNCAGLKDIYIPSKVKSIGRGAFENCTGITNIVIADGVETIGISAFAGCNQIKELVIPNSVTTIDYYAFKGCSELLKVVIGSGVTLIRGDAFSNCNYLVEVYNLSALDINNKSDNGNGGIAKNALAVYTSLDQSSNIAEIDDMILYRDGDEVTLVKYNGTETEVVIPNTIKRIKKYAFAQCENITKVTIAESVKIIECYAFNGCTQLKSVEFIDTEDWSVNDGSTGNKEMIVTDSSVNATNFINDYNSYYWRQAIKNVAQD